MGKREAANPNAWGNVRIEQIVGSATRRLMSIGQELMRKDPRLDFIQTDVRFVQLMLDQMKIEFDVDETK